MLIGTLRFSIQKMSSVEKFSYQFFFFLFNQLDLHLHPPWEYFRTAMTTNVMQYCPIVFSYSTAKTWVYLNQIILT